MADGGISREERRYDLERRGMKVKTCVNKMDPSGTQEAASSLKKIVVDLQYLGPTVQNDGEWKRGEEVFADRVGMGGEESPIRRMIRARNVRQGVRDGGESKRGCLV